MADNMMRVAGRDENGQARALKSDNKGNMWVKVAQTNDQINKTIEAIGNAEMRELVSATNLLIINTNPYVGVTIRINGQSEIELAPGKSMLIEGELITTVDYRSNLAPAKLQIIGGY